MRTATIERKTRETEILASVDLDGSGLYDVNTGIGFLDHMLESFSRHSLIDLKVRAQGDLHVDFHHTTEDTAIVIGQAGPLGQVFRNLIDNARSFSPDDGRVYVSAAVVRSREGNVVRATVEDEGPGIPAENLETIFERFYTQRPKGAAFGGNSGLGLSIARQIVTAHEGRIYAQNREGEGSNSAGARLVVDLPLAPMARA